jgi:hypothetical protein
MLHQLKCTESIVRLSHLSVGKSNREVETTVLKELVPMLACLNASKAGLSGFWSSVVRYKRSLWPARKRRALGTSGIR